MSAGLVSCICWLVLIVASLLASLDAVRLRDPVLVMTGLVLAALFAFGLVVQVGDLLITQAMASLR